MVLDVPAVTNLIEIAAVIASASTTVLVEIPSSVCEGSVGSDEP